MDLPTVNELMQRAEDEGLSVVVTYDRQFWRLRCWTKTPDISTYVTTTDFNTMCEELHKILKEMK